MKVEVEMKITILDGEEKGRTYNDKFIADTEQRFTPLGIREELRIGWNKMIPYEENKQ